MNRGALMARLVGAALTCLAAAHICSVPALAEPPRESHEQVLPGLDAVIGELRRGGLVIYFRHGPTDPSSMGDAEDDLSRCETQRNLSAEGRDQATRIGSAIRALGIPVGAVTASPFCRCRDTASLAFGQYSVSNDLYFALDADPASTTALAKSLRRLLSTPPAIKTNAVIVAHTANLREATGIWPKPEGVAYVFRPLPGARFEVVAKVAPEDWPNAVKGRAR